MESGPVPDYWCDGDFSPTSVEPHRESHFSFICICCDSGNSPRTLQHQTPAFPAQPASHATPGEGSHMADHSHHRVWYDTPKSKRRRAGVAQRWLELSMQP